MIKFDKKTYMPVIVLVSICVAVALLLAGVYMLTADRIASASAEKENQSLTMVMPDGKFNEEPDALREDAPETVKAVYTEQNGKGHVVLLTTNKGYTGKNISLTVAIDTEGKIINAVITQNEESIVPTELKPMGTYGEKYKGLDAEGAKNLETGATVKFTETAIKSAINDAFKYLGYLDGAEPEEPEEAPEEPEQPAIPEQAKSESEIVTLAAALVQNSNGFTKVELDERYKNLIYVYKENSGKGYVAYTLVISESYGTVESEALIHIGNDGSIEKISKLTWKTSDAMYGYVPPTADLVDAFYAAIDGKTSSSIDTVTLVSNATNTSTNVVKSVKEALSAVEKLIRNDEVLVIAKDFVGGSPDFVDVTPKDKSYIRKLYKNKADGTYLAHVVVISENYGTVETETLVHIGTDGKIINVKKIVWKTSDAIYGYVPPSSDLVDAFYLALPGKDIAALDAMLTNKQLVSNATSTSTGLVKSIKEALTAAEALIKEDAILALSKELAGGSPDFEDVTPAKSDYIVKLYKNKADGTYVAHVVVISKNYGTVETETLIHIGTDGKIINVKKIVWKTSDAIYGYVPPTANLVDAFYAGLVGKDVAALDAMITNKTLVSNATSTSTGLVNSIKEAITVASDLMVDERVLDLATELVGGAPDFENVTPKNSEYVVRLYRNKVDGTYVAHVVVISKNYGTVETETLIHIGVDGKIKNVKKIVWKTSDAIYGYVPPTADLVDAFYERLPGNSASSIGSVALVSNATSTSTGLVNSIKEALKEADKLIMATLPTPEQQLLDLAKDLVGGSPDLENVPVEDTEYVRRLYKNKADGTYVAYIVVMSRYGTVETETLVHIGTDGKIINVKKIVWKTSDAMYGYVPPAAELVDAFYQRLPGNSASSIDSVALVSNATSTSTGLVKSIKEALTVSEAFIRKEYPTFESELIPVISEFLGNSPDLEKVAVADTEYLRLLYRNKADGSYVAYLVVMSQYGTVETETLVHIGANGRIKNIKRMIWKTSDAMYGYVPPTLEEAEVIYKSLVGTDINSIDGATLVSNATNTSHNLVDSVREALLAVEELEKSSAPRVIGIVAVVLLVALWAAAFVILRKRRSPYEK